MLSAAVGVADHNGWAVLVSVAADEGVPIVIDRRRVPLIEKGIPSQPYHHETLALAEDESEHLVREVKRSVASCTARAFERLVADLSPTYRVKAIAIRQPPLETLPRTVKEVHASYYTTCRADGMLYHVAICDVARKRRWDVVQHARGDEVAIAAAALRTNERDVERFLGGLKKTLGPPWAAEHRHAFAAATASLGDGVSLSVPRGGRDQP